MVLSAVYFYFLVDTAFHLSVSAALHYNGYVFLTYCELIFFFSVDKEAGEKKV